MGDEMVGENGCSAPLDDEINDKIIEKQEDSEKTFDEESDTRSNSIHIEVKVTDRKESSIDTEYDDYVKKFGGEDYLLDIKDSEDDINCRTGIDADCFSFSQQSSIDHNISHKEDENLNILAKEQTQIAKEDSSPEFEFWCGYGTNIYFQPMKCKTLPCLRTKRKDDKSQLLRFSKQGKRKNIREFSPISFRMDIPVIKDALENIGTLKITEDKNDFPDRTAMSNNEPELPSRVGKFMWSEDLKKRLCKGFVCRNQPNASSLTKSISYRDWDQKNVEFCAKNSAIPSRRSAIKLSRDGQLNKQDMKEYAKERTNFSYDGRYLLGQWTKMNRAMVYSDKIPRTKFIAGKTMQLTNICRTINKINLFPFSQSFVCKENHAKRFEMPVKLLHPSPVPDEEQKPEEELEEKVVVDHLREMKKSDTFDSQSSASSCIEDHYAYDSMLSYYDQKVKDKLPRSENIENTLFTRSLLSSCQRKPRDDNSSSLEKSEGDGAPRKSKFDRNNGGHKIDGTYSRAGAQHAICVTGKELNFTGKNSMPSEFSERTPPASRRMSSSESESRPNIMLLDEQSEYDLYKNTENFESYDLTNDRSKSVHFEKRGENSWPNETKSTVPLIAKSSKPVDRYEIPSSKKCRLPIIGQKIAAYTT